jgi:hypothetical protein
MLLGCISGHVARKPNAHDMPLRVPPLCGRPGATHSADTSVIVQACLNPIVDEYSPCLSRHSVYRATQRGVHVYDVHIHEFGPVM